MGMCLLCNFVNICTIAYRVHVYMHTSLIDSVNPNPDLSNRISPSSSFHKEVCIKTHVDDHAHGRVQTVTSAAALSPSPCIFSYHPAIISNTS